jgi:hypothetical protein
VDDTAGRDSFVVEQLCAEFGDRVDPATIRTVAAEELARLADATVRDFVPIFTWRRSRARIRQQLELAAQEPAEDLSRSA